MLVAVLVVLALIKILLKIHTYFYSNICSNHSWHYGCSDKASVATNYAIMVAKVPRYRQTTMINILLLLLYFGILFISLILYCKSKVLKIIFMFLINILLFMELVLLLLLYGYSTCGHNNIPPYFPAQRMTVATITPANIIWLSL